MNSGNSRLAWGVAAVFALLFAASMSGIVQGGALDPPGPPASTMKSLDDVPPAWNQLLSATGGCTSARYQCVFNDLAVLDRETGLVWQRDPAPTTATWEAAIRACLNFNLNVPAAVARRGWRLPTAEEFQSIFDFTADNMPDGHPFTVVTADLLLGYWASTTVAGTTTSAYRVQPANPGVTATAKTSLLSSWCVRGGQGLDGQ
jgi:hypothetical protein